MKPTSPALEFGPCPWQPPVGEQLLAALQGTLLPTLYAVLRDYPELCDESAPSKLSKWRETTTDPEARRRLEHLEFMLEEIGRSGLGEAFLKMGLNINHDQTHILMAYVKAQTLEERRLLLMRHRFLMGETMQLMLILLKEQMERVEASPIALSELEKARALAKSCVQAGSIDQACWYVEQLELLATEPQRLDLFHRILEMEPEHIPDDFRELCTEAIVAIPAGEIPYCHGLVRRRWLEALLTGRYGPLRECLEEAFTTLEAAEAVHTVAAAPDHWAHLGLYRARLTMVQSGRHPAENLPQLQAAQERLIASLEILDQGHDPRSAAMGYVELTRFQILLAGMQGGRFIDMQPRLDAARQANARARELLEPLPRDGVWQQVEQDHQFLKNVDRAALQERYQAFSAVDEPPWWMQGPPSSLN